MTSLPFAPRLMSAETAAAYLGIGKTLFLERGPDPIRNVAAFGKRAKRPWQKCGSMKIAHNSSCMTRKTALYVRNSERVVMAVWRKWEVKFADDKGEFHWVDFSTKIEALLFCKAMKRMGAVSIFACKGGDEMSPAYSHKMER